MTSEPKRTARTRPEPTLPEGTNIEALHDRIDEYKRQVTKHAPRTSAIPIVDADMDDSTVVDDVTDSAVNTHHTNKLNTRSINIMLHENEEESRSS